MECNEGKKKRQDGTDTVKHLAGHSRGGAWKAHSTEVILLGSHAQGQSERER